MPRSKIPLRMLVVCCLSSQKVVDLLTRPAIKQAIKPALGRSFSSPMVPPPGAPPARCQSPRGGRLTVNKRCLEKVESRTCGASSPPVPPRPARPVWNPRSFRSSASTPARCPTYTRTPLCRRKYRCAHVQLTRWMPTSRGKPSLNFYTTPAANTTYYQ